MPPDGEFQPLPQERNDKQFTRLSRIDDQSGHLQIGGFLAEKDQLDVSRMLAVVRRRAILIGGVAVAVTSGMVAKTLSQVPNYEGKFQLLVGPVTGEDKLDQLNQNLSKSTGVSAPTVDYSTQIKVLWSPQVLSPIVEHIRAQYPNLDYNTILSKLTITRLADTKILEIRYQDSDPEKIKFILDQIAQGYVKYSQNEQQTSVRQGIQFVEDQLPKLQGRVDKLQEKLQQFRQQYNLIEPESQGKQLSERVSTIVQQRLETETKLGETQSLYVALQKQLGLNPKGAIATAALAEAPRYQRLLNQLQEVESKIAVERARFRDESPNIQALREQQQNLLPLLREEAQKVLGPDASSTGEGENVSPSTLRLQLIQQLVDSANQMRVLEVRRQAIAEAETFMNQKLKQLAAIARQYTDLQRELQVATESLNRFLAVRENLQIEVAQKTLPWQLISAAQKPSSPISPNIPQGMLLGILAGLMAGTGAALLAEKLDNVFHSPDELKDNTGLPILGTIPFSKELKNQQPALISGSQLPGYNASVFLEAFRSLHANLHFLSADTPIRSLVISSAVPADGKSTVSSNLAHAAAAMGRRVLLIDADLRRPQIHKQTDLPNVWGLSNVISTDINVDDVIQRSPLEDNLFVLTAGQIPPDPTKLLSSKKMQALIERFIAAFDLVIFDTPPLLGLADAKLLAADTDGLVMVVGLGRTNRSVLTQVLDGVRISRVPVLGLVANGVKGYTTSSYDYYQRYYTKAPRDKALNEDARL